MSLLPLLRPGHKRPSKHAPLQNRARATSSAEVAVAVFQGLISRTSRQERASSRSRASGSRPWRREGERERESCCPSFFCEAPAKCSAMCSALDSWSNPSQLGQIPVLESSALPNCRPTRQQSSTCAAIYLLPHCAAVQTTSIIL